MRLELLELRAHFGVSAMEALHHIPAWEYDLLVEATRDAAQAAEQQPADTAGSLADPPLPEGLM